MGTILLILNICSVDSTKVAWDVEIYWKQREFNPSPINQWESSPLVWNANILAVKDIPVLGAAALKAPVHL